jgi:preprotein translocase subunit Sec63
MLYVILGCAVLLVLVTAGRRGKPVRIRREWRLVSGAGAVACFVAAAFLVFKDAWIVAIPLIVLGLAMMTGARVNPQRKPAEVRERMSEADARSILGVGPEAGAEEIQAAYRRLMERVHPDKGGASGLAAQLNAARDRLLGK